MKYYLMIHIGKDSSSIYLDSGDDNIADTLIFQGSKMKGKELIAILNNGVR